MEYYVDGTFLSILLEHVIIALCEIKPCKMSKLDQDISSSIFK